MSWRVMGSCVRLRTKSPIAHACCRAALKHDVLPTLITMSANCASCMRSRGTHTPAAADYQFPSSAAGPAPHAPQCMSGGGVTAARRQEGFSGVMPLIVCGDGGERTHLPRLQHTAGTGRHPRSLRTHQCGRALTRHVVGLVAGEGRRAVLHNAGAAAPEPCECGMWDGACGAAVQHAARHRGATPQ